MEFMNKWILNTVFELNFYLAWTESRKSYCTTPGAGIGVNVLC